MHKHCFLCSRCRIHPQKGNKLIQNNNNNSSPKETTDRSRRTLGRCEEDAPPAKICRSYMRMRPRPFLKPAARTGNTVLEAEATRKGRTVVESRERAKGLSYMRMRPRPFLKPASRRCDARQDLSELYENAADALLEAGSENW
ncbi:hypothetical protein BHE74_00014926 [Ensete ventricosum]|nr:hypothetical protein BHE74_00014926 [Ensete ventricosum]